MANSIYDSIYGGVRGTDAEGSGYYGASRGGGTRKHMGVDLIIPTTKSINLYAPISGKALPTAPYTTGPKLTASGANVNQGVKIVGQKGTVYDGLVAYMFYCVKTASGDVTIGDPVATTIPDMYSAYNKVEGKNGMTNHVHFQIKNNGQYIDPNFVEQGDISLYKIIPDPTPPGKKLTQKELDTLKKFVNSQQKP